jgi:hypothetical protein
LAVFFSEQKNPPGKRRYKTLGGTSKRRSMKKDFMLSAIRQTILAGNGYTVLYRKA